MKYRIEGTIVDTERATKSWEEASTHNGRNRISRQTGNQWSHQRLLRSRKGRFYIECWSDWDGSRARAEWISPEEACRWLSVNGDTLPDDLQKISEEISE